MEFDNDPNYYTNFKNQKVEFENLEDIENKDNVKSINYRSYEDGVLDFSIYKNLTRLYIVLPYVKNIILKNLVKLRYLYINGSMIDYNTEYRRDNYFLEELDISTCSNIVLLNISYMRKLMNIKHDLLKKLCKINIFTTVYNNYDWNIINDYNRKNIERCKKDVDKNLKCISRRRIYLLSELAESQTKIVCPKCGKYTKDIYLINVSEIPFLDNFITYTCC